MAPKISTQYKLRGVGLCLSPTIALSCWLNSFSRTRTALFAAIPISILILLDIVEAKEVNRRFAAAKNSNGKLPFVSSLAQSGREKMSKLLPKQTGKRYLVVGTGGVGRRILEMLQERGETNIYGFDICPHSAIKEVLNETHFVQGNVTSLEACQSAVKQVQPDVIFHTAAALTYAQRKPHEWDFSYNVNVKGVQNMLLAATKNSVGTFVLTSSSVAGLDRRHCFQRVSGNEETFPPISTKDNALSWYSCSKAMAEVEALQFCTKNPNAPAFGIIRPASGIFHVRDGYSCQSALMDLTTPAIGFEFMEMDYVFVDNVVLGHFLLEKELNQGNCIGETFLISNQDPMNSVEFNAILGAMVPGFSYPKMPSTLGFLLSTISEVMTSLKLSVPKELGLLTYTTWALGTIEFVMDSSKAENMLGYKPAFTVKEGVAKTIEDHIKAFPEGGLAKSKNGRKED